MNLLIIRYLSVIADRFEPVLKITAISGLTRLSRRRFLIGSCPDKSVLQTSYYTLVTISAPLRITFSRDFFRDESNISYSMFD
jgi:hypothetical protein